MSDDLKRAQERMASLRKDLVLLLHDSASQDPSRQKPPREDNKATQDKEPHLDAQQLLLGNLVKGTHSYKHIRQGQKVSAEYYAWNAWNYLGSLPKGDVRDIYREQAVDWFHFYESARKPNFFQKFPLKRLGGFDRKRVYGSVKGEPPSTEMGYRQLKHVVSRLEKFQQTAGPEEKEQADARLAYAKNVRRLLGMRDGQDKALAVNPAASETLYVGQSLPYRWQAHHILPMNCFYGYLDGWHLRVLASSTYDINHGSNIIFLPEDADDTKWHKLPHHNTDHPAYDKRLERDFLKLKDALNKMKQEKQPHDAVARKAEEDLLDLETKTFKYISKSMYKNGQFRML